jgi:hypothetical protein
MQKYDGVCETICVAFNTITKINAKSIQYPPKIELSTTNNEDILNLLKYACLNEFVPGSAAENYAIDVFKFAREFVLSNSIDRVTFDWDHTLSIYLLVKGLKSIPAKLFKKNLPAFLSNAQMTVLESGRPFMQEFAFGMMVGFAIKQQIQSFTQWENYIPQVGIVTLTWPARIAALAQNLNLLSLAEGVFPRKKNLYELIIQGKSRAFIHLHDFINYLNNILEKISDDQYSILTAQQKNDVNSCLQLGKGHKLKIPGLLEEKGWLGNRHLHFDDCILNLNCLTNYKDKKISGVLVRQSQSQQLGVREIDKINFSSLWSTTEKARTKGMHLIASKEYSRSTLPAIISLLSNDSTPSLVVDNLCERTTLPPGVCLNFYEGSISVGEFWEYYLIPVKKISYKIQQIKNMIKKSHKTRVAK